jgi:hypothetical protein
VQSSLGHSPPRRRRRSQANITALTRAARYLGASHDRTVAGQAEAAVLPSCSNMSICRSTMCQRWCCDAGVKPCFWH